MNFFTILYIASLSATSSGDGIELNGSSLEHDLIQETQQATILQIERADVHKQSENHVRNAREDKKIQGLEWRSDGPSKRRLECSEGECFSTVRGEGIRAQSDSRTSSRRRKHKDLTSNLNFDFLTALRTCSATVGQLVEDASRHNDLKSAGAADAKLTKASKSFVINRATMRDTFKNLAPFYLPKPSLSSRHTEPEGARAEERDFENPQDLPLSSFSFSSLGENNHGDEHHVQKFNEENTASVNMKSPLALKPLIYIPSNSNVRELTPMRESPNLSDSRKSVQNKSSLEKNYYQKSRTTAIFQNMQDELQRPELKARQTEARQTEARQTEARQTEARQTEARQTEARQTEARQTEALQTEAEMQVKEAQASPPEISPACDQAVTALYEAFEGVGRKLVAEDELEHFWHLKFLDSWGKAGDGFLMGNLRRVGLMEECLHAKGRYIDQASGDLVHFTGQYCTVATAVMTTGNKSLEGMVGVLPLLYGTCVPSTCTALELKESVNAELSELNYAAEEVWCRQRDADMPWHTWDYVGCSIIGLMVLMVVLATVAHAVKDNVPRVVQAFSAIENYRKISTIKMDSTGQITCFYGIRVLSICWIILGHQYAYITGFGYNLLMMSWMTQDFAFQIIWTGYKAVDTFFIIGGLLATQAIVKMDFLGTSKLKKKSAPGQSSNAREKASNTTSDLSPNADLPSDEKSLEMNEIELLGSKDQPEDAEIGLSAEKSVIADPSTEDARGTEVAPPLSVTRALANFLTTYAIYVCHRLLRLLPTMFLIIMFCAGPSSFLVDGPNRRRYEEDYIVPCRTNWWVDLTLFSNVIFRVTGVKADNDPDYGPVDSCISHSWYLAVDFQLYLVAPLVLLPLQFQLKKYGVWYLSVVALVFCLVPGIIVAAQDLLPAMLITLNEAATLDYSRKIYMMPYARAAPYFLGGVCGLLLLQSKDAPLVDGVQQHPPWRRLLDNKVVRAGGWLVFLVTFSSVMFGLYGSNEVSVDVTVKGDHQLSDAASFFYASFANAAWAICVCWIVLLCALRLADPVNEFLSHPFWHVPCRVSYPLYLISLPVQKWVFYSLLADVYLSYLTIMLSYCGVLVISFLAAFFISLVAEAPYIGLSKIILESSAKKRL